MHGVTVKSSTLSLISALDGGGWSTPRPGRFTPGKQTRYALPEAGWTSGWSGQVRKIFPLPGFDPRTVQPPIHTYNYTPMCPVEIQPPARRTPIGRGMTAPTPVIAQQCSSATLVTLRSQYRREKFRDALKNVI
jgi:hypothetical protein